MYNQKKREKYRQLPYQMRGKSIIPKKQNETDAKEREKQIRKRKRKGS